MTKTEGLLARGSRVPRPSHVLEPLTPKHVAFTPYDGAAFQSLRQSTPADRFRQAPRYSHGSVVACPRPGSLSAFLPFFCPKDPWHRAWHRYFAAGRFLYNRFNNLDSHRSREPLEAASQQRHPRQSVAIAAASLSTGIVAATTDGIVLGGLDYVLDRSDRRGSDEVHVTLLRSSAPSAALPAAAARVNFCCARP